MYTTFISEAIFPKSTILNSSCIYYNETRGTIVHKSHCSFGIMKNLKQEHNMPEHDHMRIHGFKKMNKKLNEYTLNLYLPIV